jgi:hypothetical protein
MNPAGRGLDFDENPDHKSDFLRYAIQLNCINPIRDIIKSPLPPLEEIARGVLIQLREAVKLGTQSRRDLEAALKTTGIEADLFPNNQHDCEMNFALNKHLGAERAMSAGRVQDLEGAKTVVISHAKTAGATTAVIKRRFQITCYT